LERLLRFGLGGACATSGASETETDSQKSAP
jgi:hypothetical protein